VSDHGDPFGSLVGQDAAASMLRAAGESPVPAYLLVGPSGAGVRQAAGLFAGELLAAVAEPSDADRHRRLAVAEEHPDFVVIERVGPFITTEQARDAVRAANTSPVEGSRKVVMLTDLHLVRDAGPMLLKAVEEPPPSTFFVLVAEEVPPELITIASRCVVVEFAAVSVDDIVDALVEAGVDERRARFAATASGGSLERAQLLVTDDEAAARWQAWADLPDQLDGTGAKAATCVDGLLGMLEGAAAPLEARHAEERAALELRAEQFGERGLGRSGFDDRQKRELRRLRVDELQMGLVALGGALRDRVIDARLSPKHGAAVLSAVHEAGVALQRNPNERLLLQRVLLEVGATERS
jgi:DNA polymerase III subunit delta'